MAMCEICGNDFTPKNKSRPPRTCSKECKNELARRITIKQFSDPAAREIQRKKSLEQKKNPEYQEKFKQSIAERDKRWREEGHPRTGMTHSDTAKEKIGRANKGRFKGKSWEQIYGKKVANRRRVENSVAMCRTNEELLVDKKSNYENLVYRFVKDLGFKRNKQIGRFNVDFLNENTKTIIEFNGDYWHMNPALYNEDFFNPVTKIQAKDKWDLDKKRKAELESLGYEVIVWWESEMIKNRKINESAIKAAIEDYNQKH
jgi:very-short-patch-repair endonuclease